MLQSSPSYPDWQAQVNESIVGVHTPLFLHVVGEQLSKFQAIFEILVIIWIMILGIIEKFENFYM